MGLSGYMPARSSTVRSQPEAEVAWIEHVAGGNETIGVDAVHAGDPAHTLPRERCKTQLLAACLGVQRLVLRLGRVQARDLCLQICRMPDPAER